MDLKIRVATPEDAQTVHDIYGAYVEEEHVTFTIENPSVKDYEEQIIHTLKRYPFYIAEDESGKVLGYVKGAPLRPHDAYKWDVESTIMLAPDAPRRCGIARALYEKFCDTLGRQGYRQVYAVIVDSNEASIAVHEALGFESVGHFKNCGFKAGKWKGIVWMKKDIGEAGKTPEEPIGFMDMHLTKSAQGQVMPDGIYSVGREAFAKMDCTEIRWLGSASTMINSRGTNILIDPLLEGFDMPLLFDIPLAVSDVPALDAILVTHIDNDHFSRMTCKDLRDVCASYHAPAYVAEAMNEEGIPGIGHEIDEEFQVKDVKVTLTPAKHNWQNEDVKYSYRQWKEEDYCGYWLDTADGSIWMPGDSRLLDVQLHMPKKPDVMLFDFSDNEWHITFDGAVKLANAYPDATLICIHWGTVDSPEFSPFNGDPEKLARAVVNPERVLALRPGEKFILKK